MATPRRLADCLWNTGDKWAEGSECFGLMVLLMSIQSVAVTALQRGAPRRAPPCRAWPASTWENVLEGDACCTVSSGSARQRGCMVTVSASGRARAAALCFLRGWGCASGLELAWFATIHSFDHRLRELCGRHVGASELRPPTPLTCRTARETGPKVFVTTDLAGPGKTGAARAHFLQDHLALGRSWGCPQLVDPGGQGPTTPDACTCWT